MMNSQNSTQHREVSSAFRPGFEKLEERKVNGSLLIIDDDSELLELVKDYYRPRKFKVDVENSALAPISRFRRDPSELNNYDVIICDLKMPNFDGLLFVQELKALAPDLPVILMTAYSSLELAVEAVRMGAYDFVNKPLNFPQLTVSIERALQLREIRSENENLKSTLSRSQGINGIIARSNKMNKVVELCKRVARSSANVLIQGESGTGKELIAKALHSQSSHAQGPYIAINCSAIPETLLESELFGYAKGAFTGAQDRKLGLFEEANKGTLFLDEIGDLSLALQAKLLRVIQERKIKRLGENQFRNVDVRIIVATHKDLATEVREGRFRQDLFFRLNVIKIEIPPLRERREDILPLTDHFLKKYAATNSSSIRGFTKAAQEYLYQQPWYGNVRELENAVERAVVLARDEYIDVPDLPLLEATEAQPPKGSEDPPTLPSNDGSEPRIDEFIEPMGQASPNLPTKGNEHKQLFVPLQGLSTDELLTMKELNLKYIQFVLEKVGGVRERAARILDIDRKTLYRKLEEAQRKGDGSTINQAGGGLT